MTIFRLMLMFFINERSIITIILLETTEIFPFKRLAVIDSKPNNQ